MKYNKKLFIFTLLGIGLFLYAGGVEEVLEEEEPLVLQDIYAEMDPSLPVVGFFPPQFRSSVSEEQAVDLVEDITASLVLRGTMKPGSLNEWMDIKYDKKAPGNILELNEMVQKAKLPLDYTALVKVFPFGRDYLFRLALYTPGKPEETLYVYRIFHTFKKEWQEQLPSILNELDYRLSHRTEQFSSDTIYLEPFKLHYFDYYELKCGEYVFTEIPFITMDDMDYWQDDDIFSEWLGLRLHLSGFFPVVIHDFEQSLEEEKVSRKGCTWGIQGDISISEKMSVLRLSIYNYRLQEKVAEYKFPFNGIEQEEVSSVIDRSLPFILDCILSNEMKQVITLISPEFKGGDVYRESGYQGPSNLISSYPVKVGLNRFLVESEGDIPLDLSGYNQLFLVNPEGEIYHTFLDEEIHYGEKLFD
jgi:hypothetical protein